MQVLLHAGDTESVQFPSFAVSCLLGAATYSSMPPICCPVKEKHQCSSYTPSLQHLQLANTLSSRAQAAEHRQSGHMGRL